MSIFVDSLWIWFVLAFVVGAVGYTMFVNDRKIQTLALTVLTTIAVLVLGLSLYYWVDTDQKSIKRTLDGLIATIQKDDADKVIDQYISPKAKNTRGKARANMGLVRITSARYRDLKIKVNPLTSPPTAEISFEATVFFNWKNRAEFPSDQAIPQIVKFQLVELEKTPSNSWLVTDKCEFTPGAIGQF